MVVSTVFSQSTDTKRSIAQNGVEQSNSVEGISLIDRVAGKLHPKGKYTLVGIDIDTTGRRLIDEV